MHYQQKQYHQMETKTHRRLDRVYNFHDILLHVSSANDVETGATAMNVNTLGKRKRKAHHRSHAMESYEHVFRQLAQDDEASRSESPCLQCSSPARSVATTSTFDSPQQHHERPTHRRSQAIEFSLTPTTPPRSTVYRHRQVAFYDSPHVDTTNVNVRGKPMSLDMPALDHAPMVMGNILPILPMSMTDLLEDEIVMKEESE